MSREEALQILDTIPTIGEQVDALEMAIKALEQEPKIGRWIEKDGYDGDTYYDCSECGESWTTIEGTPWNNGMKFCPNCGARMAESGDKE